MKLIKDNAGNVLLLESCRHGFALFIRLREEHHRRLVGKVVIKTRRMHLDRDPDLHLLNKADAYGFNFHVLNTAKTFDTIILHETGTGKVYQLDRNEMIANAKYLFFKEQGFEKQIFLSRDWIAQYEITQPEKKKALIAEKRAGI